jgi:hypothetical protein
MNSVCQDSTACGDNYFLSVDIGHHTRYKGNSYCHSKGTNVIYSSYRSNFVTVLSFYLFAHFCIDRITFKSLWQFVVTKSF